MVPVLSELRTQSPPSPAKIAIIRKSFNLTYKWELPRKTAPEHTSIEGRFKRYQCFPRSVQDAFLSKTGLD